MAGNNVTVIGNATRDPELRFTNTGQAVATFGIAVNRSWRNKQTNEWEEQVSFFDVTCWAQMAENVAESVQKGSRVIVTGRLDQRSWESNGEKRSKVEIVADEIGPSLRWATASISKNERRGGDFDGGGGSGGGSGGGGGGSAPVANEPPPGYDSDEEPF